MRKSSMKYLCKKFRSACVHWAAVFGSVCFLWAGVGGHESAALPFNIYTVTTINLTGNPVFDLTINFTGALTNNQAYLQGTAVMGNQGLGALDLKNTILTMPLGNGIISGVEITWVKPPKDVGLGNGNAIVFNVISQVPALGVANPTWSDMNNMVIKDQNGNPVYPNPDIEKTGTLNTPITAALPMFVAGVCVIGLIAKRRKRDTDVVDGFRSGGEAWGGADGRLGARKRGAGTNCA